MTVTSERCNVGIRKFRGTGAMGSMLLRGIAGQIAGGHVDCRMSGVGKMCFCERWVDV